MVAILSSGRWVKDIAGSAADKRFSWNTQTVFVYTIYCGICSVIQSIAS